VPVAVSVPTSGAAVPIVEKYKNLRAHISAEDRAQNLTKEQMEIRKVEGEIQQLLSRTQSIADKWHRESDEVARSESVTQRAEHLYTKF
jgi:hypothetical protein